MKPLKEKVSMTLDSTIMEKIRVLAERDDRGVSSYVNLILRDYLEQLEQKLK